MHWTKVDLYNPTQNRTIDPQSAEGRQLLASWRDSGEMRDTYFATAREIEECDDLDTLCAPEIDWTGFGTLRYHHEDGRRKASIRVEHQGYTAEQDALDGRIYLKSPSGIHATGRQNGATGMIFDFINEESFPPEIIRELSLRLLLESQDSCPTDSRKATIDLLVAREY